MKKVLVSLVSEQTIPNVELILELRNEISGYLFIVTGKIKNEGQKDWIIKACRLEEAIVEEIEVEPFNMEGIELKLKDYEYKDEESYIVNITGGTKLMSMVILDFFKKLGATIYYLTGTKNTYLKIFPERGKRVLELNNKLSLEEYLSAFGFEISGTGSPIRTKSFTNNIFKSFTSSEANDWTPELMNQLRSYRSKNLMVETIDGLGLFLRKINFVAAVEGKLNKYEVRYLTGEWFEEYIYFLVKNELGIDEKELGMGYKLIKYQVANEFDVLFVFNNRLFMIECKTSIYETITLPNGKKKNKNLLPEIVYKVDSLQKRFGLFAVTSIFTLDRIRDEQGNILQDLSMHIDRAELSRISIISKRDLVLNKPIKELLNI